jgi:predicted N-formylglutamate amidohydrolase
MKEIALILTCEHAVNTIPRPYQELFNSQKSLLQTHRGCDFGALEITNYLSQRFACDSFLAQTSRLLIDFNRSLSHRNCFSPTTASLPKEEKIKLIQRYYLPYRDEVERKIKKLIAEQAQVWHLSIHSFTPILDNTHRNTDIGLLYDPGRPLEKKIGLTWQKQLRQQYNNGLRIRRNYPYRGISNSFTTALRQQFADKDYAGLEVEVNQATTGNDKSLAHLSEALTVTLKRLLVELCETSPEK